MNKVELLSSIADRPRTPGVAAAKQAMVEVYNTPPSHVEAYTESVKAQGLEPELPALCLAATIDIADRLTNFSQRQAAYKLNRELGLPRRHALIHASAATGLAVASMVEMTTQPEHV